LVAVRALDVVRIIIFLVFFSNAQSSLDELLPQFDANSCHT
jgi:hypothetical protein